MSTQASTRHASILHLLKTYTTCIMALRSKWVATRAQKYGLTHFLAIPLVSPTSRSYIRDLFECLWDDLAALGVPKDAIQSLGLLHVNLEASLSLKTPERMAKAKKILQQLSIKKFQPTSHKSSISRNCLRYVSGASPISKNDIKNIMAPPSVSISGLFCSPGKEANTFSLHANVYDATHRVKNWKLRVAHAYQAAGLSPGPRRHRDSSTRAAMDELLESSAATICLMRIHHSTVVIPCHYDPGKVMNANFPPCDARGLLERYKDHLWVENAPLERVSICKIGLLRLGPKELQEDFSVPL